MSIRIECDGCSKKLSVGDDKAGKRVRCPGCQTIITIPAVDNYEDELKPEPIRPRKGSAKGRGKSKTKPASPPWLLIGGGVGAAATIGLLAVVLLRGPDEVAPENLPQANHPAANAGGTPSVAGVPVSQNSGATSTNSAGVSPTNSQPGTGAVPPSTTATSPKSPLWKVVADPLAQSIEWPASWSGKIEVYGGPEDALFPTSLSTVFADVEGGQDVRSCQVWNLATGTKLSGFKTKTAAMNERRLSPDGRLLLGRALDRENHTKVDVWSLESGELIKQIVADTAGMSLTFADFLPGDRIVTFTFGRGAAPNSFVHRLRAFDVKSGEMVWQTGDDALFEPKKSAFSPGRRFLASAARNAAGELVIYDLTTGEMAAKQSLGRGGVDMIEAVAFSAQGDQLAVAINSYPAWRLVILDVASGKEVREQRFPVSFADYVPGTVYNGPAMEWLPDGGGLLLGGTLVLDPTSGRRIWMCRTASNELALDHVRRRVPIPGGLLMLSGQRRKAKMTLLPMSAEITTLARSLSSESSSEAIIKPGQKVSLAVQIGKLLHGNPEDTLKGVTDMYRELLEAAGIEVADNQPVTLSVSYNETTGNQFQQSQGRFGTGAATGPVVQGTKAQVQLAWIDNTQTSLWKHSFEFNPTIVSAQNELNAETARKSMFEQFQRTAFQEPLPYYISTDKKTQLPTQVTLTRE